MTRGAGLTVKTRLRRAHLRVAGSRVGRVCDVRLVARMTDALYTMTVDDVLAVVDALADAGVEGWLAGGWGVDALLGRQTRDHADLDLMVPDTPAVVDRASRALVAIGLVCVATRPASGPMPAHTLFADIHGRSVDLLAIPSDGGDRPSTTVGTLRGRPVACLSRDTQLRLHTGIPLPRAARADVAALRSEAARGSPPPASPRSATHGPPG